MLLIGGVDWRDTIARYLTGEEPEDTVEAKCLWHQARNYRIINGQLYKGDVCTPFLRCVSQQEGRSLLRDIHKGPCGAHQVPQCLMARAFRQGFYWLTALRDAQDLVQHYQGCQWVSYNSKAPAVPLQPLPPVNPSYDGGSTSLTPSRRLRAISASHSLPSSIFFQMDKGRASSKNHGCRSSAVCMEKHHL